MRADGIELLAVGTGEADEQYLGDLTGDPGRVFYADEPEDISRAFVKARRVLFSGASGEQEVQMTGSQVLVRGLCWGLVGALLGLAQGIALGSLKKLRNALLGGLAGGLVGGLLFDPISTTLQIGWASRLLAIVIIGGLTGLMIGIVEGVLKDAWLRVLKGPLAGKEFVLYRNPTVLGSSPKCEIYLFKDEAVEPRHASISSDGGRYTLKDLGTQAGTHLNDARVTQRPLRKGDRIRIGKTVFQYSEKTS